MGFFDRFFGKKSKTSSESRKTTAEASSASARAPPTPDPQKAAVHWVPSIVTERVQGLIENVGPSPLTGPVDWVNCPTLTNLANPDNQWATHPSLPQNRQSPVIDRNEHWPMSEIRQLPSILLPCIRDRMTASDLGIFLVVVLYHRDRNLGGALTVLVDAGCTYEAISRNIVKYLCLYNNRGTFLSDDLDAGDAAARPVLHNRRSVQHNTRSAPAPAPRSAPGAALMPPAPRTRTVSITQIPTQPAASASNSGSGGLSPRRRVRFRDALNPRYH